MPVLSAEPDAFPMNLLESGEAQEPEGFEEPSRQWWCLHTKPRQEKALARKLFEGRIGYYLPQVTQERRTPKGRVIRSILPMFPGYVFLFGTDEDRQESLRTEHIVQVLRVQDQEMLIGELRQIHRLSHSGLAIVPEPCYAPGTRVKVMNGPLKGLVGQVIRRQNQKRFMAVVHFLGRGISVEMSDWQVEEFREEPERNVRDGSRWTPTQDMRDAGSLRNASPPR